MNSYIRYMILVLLIAPVPAVNAQVGDVSFEYDNDDLSSYHFTYRSYYSSGSGHAIYFEPGDTLMYSFEWDFGDGSTGSRPVVIHRYPSAGTYDVSLTVTNLTVPGEAWSSGIKTVTAGDSFEVPNVFTPDGDGINDNFVVRSNGVTPLNITILDRAGSIVYKNSSPVISWDGRTAAGTRVSPGIYYYVITSSEPLYNKNGFVHVFYSK